MSTSLPNLPTRPPHVGSARSLLLLLGLSSIAAVSVGCSVEGIDTPPRIGDPLPEFSAPRLGDGEVALEDYEGSPVIVNLWATWCAPCRQEMPYLESVSRAYAADGLRMVGISTDHSGALGQVRTVVEERGVTYEILLDVDARSTDLFGAYGLPVTFLADARGIITWMKLGPIVEGDETFVAALDAATGRAPRPSLTH